MSLDRNVATPAWEGVAVLFDSSREPWSRFWR